MVEEPIIHIIPSDEENVRLIQRLFMDSTSIPRPDITVELIKKPRVEMSPWLISP